jgi:linoleoyl-CoA desaturase
VKFAQPDDAFLPVLRQRVDDMFSNTSRRRRDCTAMYVKTATILIWFAASYVLLVLFAATWWQALLAAVSLGLAMASIGFNIQHDGAHSAYSSRSWINSLMAMALDMLGGSSFFWKKTHNQIHHSYTNITGHDGDIDMGVLGRLSPHQESRRFHRLQHLYLWILYGFLPFKWQFFDDIRGAMIGRIGINQFSRPRGLQLLVFIAGKLLFLSLAFAIPMLVHSWHSVLLFFFVTSFVQGLTLSVVFQLAHCVEEAEFPMPAVASGEMERAWAVHQVETTVDFARRSRLITWFTGGLNHQIEHHLFPQICHVNYPAIAELMETTCREFGVRYAAHDSLFSAIRAHYRWLRRMGQPTVSASDAMVG